MIVIPMAGHSSRFLKAGYDLPKFMLTVKGATVFSHSVNSFKEYFETLPFLFIARDERNIREFLRIECEKLSITNHELVFLQKSTRGQSETVVKGLDQLKVSDDTPLTIFNIDTFRPKFRFPKNNQICSADGYLEVFKGSGDNWSYVRPVSGKSTKIIEVAEKKRISNLCCTGLYHFKRTGNFREAYNGKRVAKSKAEAKEEYVAPLYNYLIERGSNIHYQKVELKDVVFCGTPSEYESLL